MSVLRTLLVSFLILVLTPVHSEDVVVRVEQIPYILSALQITHDQIPSRDLTTTDLFNIGLTTRDVSAVKKMLNHLFPQQETTSKKRSMGFQKKRTILRLLKRQEASAVDEPTLPVEPEQTTVEPTLPAEPEVPVQSVDWEAFLTGIVDSANIVPIRDIFVAHRLDLPTLSKLSVDGLQSIGITKVDAVNVITKLELQNWLVGVVNDDDIQNVIKISLANRINLSALLKLGLTDMANAGIALGDATRIYAKANPTSDQANTLPASVDAVEPSNNTGTPILINIILHTNGGSTDNATNLAVEIEAGDAVAEVIATPKEETNETPVEETEETVEEPVIVAEVIPSNARRALMARLAKRALSKSRHAVAKRSTQRQGVKRYYS